MQERSPQALRALPLNELENPPYSANQQTQSLYVKSPVSPETRLILLADSLVRDYLLDSQIAFSATESGSITLRRVSIGGQILTEGKPGAVTEMVVNEARLLGQVTASVGADNRVKVRFGGEERQLAPGEQMTVRRQLQAEGKSAESEVRITYVGRWPLRQLTYLDAEEK